MRESQPLINHLTDLSEDFGVLKIHGKDALKLLQGQLTTDVSKLKEGETQFSAHCNSQGRIVSLFYLYFFADTYYLIMPKTILANTITALKKYTIFFKVELLDVSDNYTLLGLQHSEPQSTIEPNTHLISVSSDQSILLIPKAHALSTLQKLNRHFSIQAKTNWHAVRLAHGIPLIYSETIEKFLPHDLNLITLNAVSFSKGCYTGQEIIARMHYKAKLKKHMVKAYLDHAKDVLPGDEIYYTENNETIAAGVLVDHCKLENHTAFLILVEDVQAKNAHLFLSAQHFLSLHEEKT